MEACGNAGKKVMNRVCVYVVVGILLGVALIVPLSSSVAENGQGKALYEDKCASCHGTNGDGQGPLASVFNPSPADFRNHAFWQGNVDQKIANTVENGHGPMPAIDLNSIQIQTIIDYMSHTFK
jgi:mono/diheme cytochrome c family protein